MTENPLFQARKKHTPLIDGQTVTFLWQGETAPRLIGDFNGWEEGGGTELQQTGQEDLWSCSIDLPLDAYIEYAFLDGHERLPDPYNPRKVSNGMGKYNNYFAMPEAKMETYTRMRRNVPQGERFSEVVQGGPLVIGGKRRVYFYQPPVEQPCPLMVVWDGQDYFRRAHLPNIVDNLIHEGRIQPIALLMPEHGRKARMLEYGCSDITLGFLGDVLLPLAKKRLNLIDIAEQPGAYGVLGASMGGLMALYTGLRMPEIFGKVLSQSGAFSFPGHDMVVWDLARVINPEQMKIWMDAGTMEWLLEINQRMAALLEERGFDFVYHEYQGGHNYPSWRNDLIDGLVHLFPPQKENAQV